MAPQDDSLLGALRSVSKVDCDSLDVEVAKELGPFVDCTSNQAIALGELSKKTPDGELYHEQLIRDSVEDAQGWARAAWPDVEPVLLAVEIMMVRLSLQFAPYLTGFCHVQTNTNYSYSIEKTRYNAQRIVQIFKKLDPGFDVKKRVCVKIPSTWEGIAACRILERDEGIATLATTMFCMEQAALAADAGCTYVAPYVNELRVHFVPGCVDEHKAFDFCRRAQAYYLDTGAKTRVLAASLTSVAEVMRLAGIQHVTVSPPLLRGLAAQPAATWTGGEGGLGGYFAAGPERKSGAGDFETILRDESEWRLAFTRSGEGRYEEKLIQAINIFGKSQDGLEELARRYF